MTTVGSATVHVYYGPVHNVVDFRSETLSLLVFPGGEKLTEGFKLKSPLLVELRTSVDGVLAVTYLETQEYGWGNTEQEAVQDLISSLVEYLSSLEEQEDMLGAPTTSDLVKLRALIRHSSQ